MDKLKPCPFCIKSDVVLLIDFEGKRRYLDWDETLERREDGLHKVEEAR
jgi:hypothetical protein